MKRTLLFAAMIVSGLAYGQKTSDLHKTDLDKLSAKSGEAIDLKDGSSVQGRKHSTISNGQLDKSREDVYSFVQIGSSYYDLQTNASVGRRILLHDDGTISTVWTYSPDASAGWPDRGTGSNYYDGSAWGSSPSARNENLRTGWPSIVELADGGITTFAHVSSDGGFVRATTTKGSGTWTSQTPVLQGTSGVPIWNRSASSGDTVHLVSNYWSDGGAVPDFIKDGITNPMTYSRSFDGGVTWEDELIFLPGYDSNFYLNGGGDNYAIDVEGSTVAIVTGGRTRDVALWKSEDNGANWTKSVIMPFVYPAFEWGSRIIPQDSNYTTSDGSLDVLIDDAGNCHVVTGMSGIYDEDTTDELMSIPNYFSFYHWSENSPTWKVCGSPIDMDEAPDPTSGANWTFSDETMASLGSDGQPPAGLAYAARYGATSISTHPSMSKDKDGNIFITYDAPIELILHDYQANLRDINVVYSTDGGDTWSDAQNATQWRTKEAVFGSQARMADDHIHFIFQADDFPGTHLQNNGNTGLHPNDEVGIYYAAIPTAEIIAGNLGANTLSAKKQQDPKVFVVSQNYPNPFEGMTKVTIYNRAGAEMSLNVTDLLGKNVMTEELGYKSAGNHEIIIDGSSLNAGIYFYTLSAGEHKVTRKMKVVK